MAPWWQLQPSDEKLYELEQHIRRRIDGLSSQLLDIRSIFGSEWSFRVILEEEAQKKALEQVMEELQGIISKFFGEK